VSSRPKTIQGRYNKLNNCSVVFLGEEDTTTAMGRPIKEKKLNKNSY